MSGNEKDDLGVERLAMQANLEDAPEEATSKGVSTPDARQATVAPNELQDNDRLPSPRARILVLLALLAFAIVGFSFFIRSCRQQSRLRVASIAVSGCRSEVIDGQLVSYPEFSLGPRRSPGLFGEQVANHSSG